MTCPDYSAPPKMVCCVESKLVTHTMGCGCCSVVRCNACGSCWREGAVQLPTVAEYEAAILKTEGHWHVNGKYIADAADAAVLRKLTAEAWHRSDVARLRRIEKQAAEEAAVQNEQTEQHAA